MSVSKEFRPVRLIKQLPRVRTLGVGVPFQNSFSIIVNALEFVSIVFAPKSTAPPLIRRFRGFCRRPRRPRPRVVLASSSRQEDQRRDAAPSPLPRVQLDDKEPFVPTRRLLLYHRKTKRLRHRATRTQRLFSLSLSLLSLRHHLLLLQEKEEEEEEEEEDIKSVEIQPPIFSRENPSKR